MTPDTHGLAVVTGAAGFIGGALVRRLTRLGRPVRAVFRHRRGDVATGRVEWRRADVRDPQSLRGAFHGAATVFHLAAVVSIEGDQGGRVTATNVQGAANAARIALESGVRRFVHVSSVHAFDLRLQDRVLDEGHPRATSREHTSYDRSKALGEAEVRRVIDSGLNGVIVHPTGALGPGDGGPTPTGQFLLDLYRGRIPALVRGGFNWVDVRDVVAGALAAESAGRRGESYLLAGHWHSMRELGEMASRATGCRIPRLVLPIAVGKIWAPIQVAWDRSRGRRLLFTRESLDSVAGSHRISARKAKRELGFKARPIHESIADAYAWFDGRGMLVARQSG